MSSIMTSRSPASSASASASLLLFLLLLAATIPSIVAGSNPHAGASFALLRPPSRSDRVVPRRSPAPRVGRGVADSLGLGATDGDAEADAQAAENTWRSALRTPPASSDPISEVVDLCSSTPRRRPDAGRGESTLAFLSVSPPYASRFPEIVDAAYETLGGDATLLSVVGGGVVGGGRESDDPTVPAMALLCGILPASAGMEAFCFGPDEPPPPPDSKAWVALGRGQDVPSYALFADPFSKIQDVIGGLDRSGTSGEEGSAVVAGGVSCPVFGDDGPTVGLNGKAYPRGSAVGIGLSGTCGIQAVVAQGCRPIGTAHSVTKAEGNMIVELDGRPAIEVLGELSIGDLLSDDDKKNIETYGVMCGLATPGAKDVQEGDYLIRQILGFRSPAVMIGAEVEEGDVLKFHVRDPAAAEDDVRNMVGRAKTERLFAGGVETAGRPMAALQVSCVARGRSLFGKADVDAGHVRSLIGADDGGDATATASAPAVGGFFANGEIGPAGFAGRGIGSKATFVHGFTAVACAICDFGTTSKSASPDRTAGEGSRMESEADSAWG
ncbi:hypothetical protein ACHAWF_015031 [Thalassiosira exigua]